MDHFTLDVVGMVGSFTEILSSVISEQHRDLVVCLVIVGEGCIQWLLSAFTVKFKSDRNCASNTTYDVEMLSFINLGDVRDNSYSEVAQRHWGEKKMEERRRD